MQQRELLIGARGRRALDVACGDGTNAVFVAQLGLEVDAVDISDAAIEIVRATADRGWPITGIRADLEQEPLPDGPYDVVVVISYLQRSLFDELARVLARGGLLIYETYTRAHAEMLGKTMRAEFMLAPGELRTSFPGLDVLRYEERIVGEGDHRKAVASLVARRPE